MKPTFYGIALIAIAVTLAGCSLFKGADSNLGEYFQEDRTYVNWLATSEEECDELNDQGVNCFQYLELFTNGVAEILLTDVTHLGNYTIENGTTLVVNLDPNPEIPEKIRFQIIDNGNQLLDDWSNSTWQLQ